jgi:hypothetical protein
MEPTMFGLRAPMASESLMPASISVLTIKRRRAAHKR